VAADLPGLGNGFGAQEGSKRDGLTEGEMPFVNGRYYANPVAGRAIEAAREAEASLAALKDKTGRNADAHDESSYSEEPSAGISDAATMKTPVHRVEIEAAELVPSHSGRAQRGFVARVHREAIPAAGAGESWHAAAPGQLPARGYVPKPETHVFAGHGDLLDFLKSELRDAGKT
jgi:hypothetical protein